MNKFKWNNWNKWIKWPSLKWPLLGLIAGSILVVFAFQNCAPNPKARYLDFPAGSMPLKHGSGNNVEGF